MSSLGYTLVARLRISPALHASGEIVRQVSASGAVITGLDVVDPGHDEVALDLTCRISDPDDGVGLELALASIPGCIVESMQDLTFLMHRGGKLGIASKVALRNRADLSRVYAPGVARICSAIHDDPAMARELTIKRNSVAVVTDGTAVLGLGALGPLAAMPVMEGKALLFKAFADVDAWPIALDTTDVDEIVRAVELIAPGFGGINLEDIAAPRCFEVERRLRERLDIPVFHDDQHGTAVVVLAALTNAAKLIGKEMHGMRIVMSGAGAAGAATARLLLAYGVQDITLFDVHGALHKGRSDLDPTRQQLVQRTTCRHPDATLSEALIGADVFIGLSQPNRLSGDDVARMADDAIVFALANPEPEIDPVEAGKHAAVVATGRSDYPNQINNVLAFPGIFRGLLDAGMTDICDEVLIAAAHAISECVPPHALNPGYIVPSVFDLTVAPAVASAVTRVGQRVRQLAS